MDFNSPARKKKRRSSFIDRRQLDLRSSSPDLEAVDNEEVKVPESSVGNIVFGFEKSKDVDEYLQKLRREKQQWIELEKSLHKKYSTLKQSKESEQIDLYKYLDYLSEDDRDYLQILDEKINESNHLCKVELPKINERLFLMSMEFKKQVETVKLINENFKIIMKKFQDLTFEKYFNDEDWDCTEYDLENSTDEFASDDELYIAGI